MQHLTNVNLVVRLLRGMFCFALLFVGLFTGCEQAGNSPIGQPPAKGKPASKRLATAPIKRSEKQRAATRSRRTRVGRRPHSTERTSLGLGSAAAVEQVTRAVDASLDLGPVLVVWIVDRSRSAATLRRQVLPRLQDWYLGRPTGKNRADKRPSLVTAIVTFGSEIEMALDPPTDQVTDINRILGEIQVDTLSLIHI